MSPYSIEHEFNDKGEHRLKIMWAFQNMKPHASKTHGDWEGYKVPAKVRHEGRTFIVFTQYYLGWFTPNKIMELKEEFEL